MEITEVQSYGKSKYKVFLNNEFAFVLYKGELKKYHLEEGNQIEADVYEDILENVLVKRAKARSLHLLMQVNRTEAQLRSKLRENLYPESVISAAVDYVKSFGYINDGNFARSYVEQRSVSKSRRQISMELMQKGVSKDVIEDALQNVETDEEEIIKLLIRKKVRNIDTLSSLDEKEKAKLSRYLMGKGFQWDKIARVFRVLDIM